jgi:hypothetical protein
MESGAQWALKAVMKFPANYSFLINMKAIVMKQKILTPLNLVCKTVFISMFMAVAGCGQGLPATVAVTGEVTYKGAPVEGANVVFGRGSRSVQLGEIAISKTDSNGRFEMVSHFGGQASKPGVVPGEYRVTVSKYIPPPNMTMAQYEKLASAAKKAGETGEMVPVDKQPPPLVDMFPPQYAVSDKSNLKANVTPAGPNNFKFALD